MLPSILHPRTCRPSHGVTGENRKLLNEELSDLYSLSNIIREIRNC